MFSSYLTIAWRNLLRHKLFSLINIIGLAVGLSSSLLIVHYVSFELSYDSFHKKGKDIYRIREDAYKHGLSLSASATTVPALAPALKRDLPEVINATRIAHTSPFMADPVMEYSNHSFFENKIYFADPSLLEMFSFHFLKGNPRQALTQPNSVIISHAMAEKYFKGEDPLGKILIFHQGVNGKRHLQVGGVFADVGQNTHFKPEFILSFSSLPKEWKLDTDWEWGNFYVYLHLAPATNPKQVEAKIPSFLSTYLGNYRQEAKSQGLHFSTTLQPLQDIHLDSNLQGELEENGSRRAIRLLSFMAFFVVMLASINYINLSTAQSIQRAKEVGVRKVIGSSRSQLISLLLSQSLLINVAALFLALTFTQLFMPYYRQMLGLNISLSLVNPWTLTIILSLFLLSTLLSGLYPAFILSAYKPVEVLKGGFQHLPNGVLLRKGLVVFQFTACIMSIACSLTVEQQVWYMLNHKLGMNLDQILIVKGPPIKDSTYQSKADLFKQALTANPAIKQVSVTSSIPGVELAWARDFSRRNESDNYSRSVKIVAVDEDFFDLYQTSFLAGRGFIKGGLADKDAVIFNERAIGALGFKHAQEAIGQQVIWQENEQSNLAKTIVGVLADFNQTSLKAPLEPMVFSLKKHTVAPWAGEYYSIKVKAENIEKTITSLKKEWQASFAGNPFDYFFLDERFDQQYKADKQFSGVLSLFAALFIFIACMGLFGLASFSTLQRTKEIGIRKVLGASMVHILVLLSRDFIRLILLSSLIAWPLSYWAMSSWLQNYAFHIHIRPWQLVLPSVFVVLIALLTVSLQTWKAARANPVKSLRYE